MLAASIDEEPDKRALAIRHRLVVGEVRSLTAQQGLDQAALDAEAERLKRG